MISTHLKFPEGHTPSWCLLLPSGYLLHTQILGLTKSSSHCFLQKTLHSSPYSTISSVSIFFWFAITSSWTWGLSNNLTVSNLQNVPGCMPSHPLSWWLLTSTATGFPFQHTQILDLSCYGTNVILIHTLHTHEHALYCLWQCHSWSMWCTNTWNTVVSRKYAPPL